MKWYWWVLIAIVLIIIIALAVKSSNAKQKALNEIAQNTTNEGGFDPFSLEQITRK